jgi:hypothetical protein
MAIGTLIPWNVGFLPQDESNAPAFSHDPCSIACSTAPADSLDALTQSDGLGYRERIYAITRPIATGRDSKSQDGSAGIARRSMASPYQCARLWRPHHLS